MRDQLILSIILGVEIFNSTTHGFGAYLLHALSRSDHDTQRLFLLNLACSEFLWNLVAIIRDAIRLAYLLICSYDKGHLVKAYFVVEMALATGVTYINYTAMLYLTVDRLLHIILHLRYDQYWNRRRTKILLGITWIFNIVLSAVFAILTYFKFGYVFAYTSSAISVYIPTGLFVLYVIVCVVTYYNMFMLHARSEQRSASHGSTTHAPTISLLKIFRKSRFFISVILIGSYMLLTVMPGLIRSMIILLKANENIRTYVSMYYLISSRISHSVDGAIYIFLQSDVRKLLYKKVACKKRFNDSEISRGIESNLRNGTFQETVHL